jgi:hypothetical protein
MTVTDRGCPLMFGPTSDAAHKVITFVMTHTGRIPKQV